MRAPLPPRVPCQAADTCTHCPDHPSRITTTLTLAPGTTAVSKQGEGSTVSPVLVTIEPDTRKLLIFSSPTRYRQPPLVPGAVALNSWQLRYHDTPWSAWYLHADGVIRPVPARACTLPADTLVLPVPS